jgi:hypothetical protein
LKRRDAEAAEEEHLDKYNRENDWRRGNGTEEADMASVARRRKSARVKISGAKVERVIASPPRTQREAKALARRTLRKNES